MIGIVLLASSQPHKRILVIKNGNYEKYQLKLIKIIAEKNDLIKLHYFFVLTKSFAQIFV